MPCDYSPYTLPTIDFVAGETQDFAFYTYFYKSHQPPARPVSARSRPLLW